MARKIAFAVIAAVVCGSATLAHATDVTIRNCARDPISVTAFDGGDILRAVPASSTTIGAKQEGSVSCTGSHCHVSATLAYNGVRRVSVVDAALGRYCANFSTSVDGQFTFALEKGYCYC